MGLINKTLANKSIIASENFDTYIGGAERLAVQIVADKVTEAQAIETTDVDTTNNKIDLNDHAYLNGVVGQLTTTDTLPSGLALTTDYYIFNKTATSFQLSLSADGGSEYEISQIIAAAEGSVPQKVGITALADVQAVAEVTEITAIAEGSVKEITQMTCVADVADSLDKKYFILQDDVGSVGFWYDVDNSGTQVDPALVSATDRQVEITTITTNMTANQVAEATYDAIIADSKFEAGTDPAGSTNVLKVQASTYGVKSAASEGNAGHTIVEDTAGVGSVLDGTYFRINSSAASYGVWFDATGSTTIPAGASALDNDIEVTINAGDSANTVATAIQTAINGDAAFGAGVATNVVTVTNAVAGAATDATDGDAGVSFNVTTQGVDANSIDGEYFVLQDDVGSVAFWYDVGDTGTSAPSHGADKAVEITTITAGMTATQVGTATYNAIVGDSKFVADVDNLDGSFVVAASTIGAKTAPADGDTGFTIAESQAGTSEVSQNKYFVLGDTLTTTVGVWLNVDTNGSEPSHGADRAIEVAISSGDSASTVADAIYDTLVADSKFEAGSKASSPTITVKHSELVAITDAVDGDTGYTITTAQQYSDVVYLDDVGVGTHTFTPEAISGCSATIQKSCDGTNWVDIASGTNITDDATFMVEDSEVAYTYIRCKFAISAGFLQLKALLTGK